MNEESQKAYDHIRSGGIGFYEQKRGLIAVWGKEAVQFLDGLISNDMKTLEDGQQMPAAFPNAQGRLVAVVRVLRQGEKYLFETEDATREKLFQNLFRFTFAGDFFVEDLTNKHKFFEVFGSFENSPPYKGGVPAFRERGGSFVSIIPNADLGDFRRELGSCGSIQVSHDLYETLRIENGIPKYGVDMDETTIVPELGLDGLISYNKGCYIGQEIIARIHFRGHVAKRLTGLAFSSPPYKGGVAEGRGSSLIGDDITALDGKNAGRITSVTYSPKLDKNIALAFVRYDHLAEGTELKIGDQTAIVTNLPFIT